MRLTLALAALVVLISASTPTQRRPMRPDDSFGYNEFTDYTWRIIAVYSKDNLDFFKQAQCMTLTFKFDPKHPSKYQSTHSHEETDSGESTDYFSSSSYYDTQTTSGSSTTEDDTQRFFGLWQNKTWFNFSAGGYLSEITEMKFHQYTPGDTQQEGVFMASDSYNSKDEWIVSLSNDYFIIYGREDASEIYLMTYNWFYAENTDDEYAIAQAYHDFNATIPDTQNVIFNSTYAQSCEIFEHPSANFSFEQFASKSWYAQSVFFPIFDSVPPAKAMCNQIEVVNVTLVNNITVFSLASGAWNKSGNNITWETQIFQYWNDPVHNGIFRPLSPNAPPLAMVIYYFDFEAGNLLWGVGSLDYGYYCIDTAELESSDDYITQHIVNKISPNNAGYAYFNAGGCNYH